MGKMITHDISIIIPTCDRQVLTNELLLKLDCQINNRVDVIVVDNGNNYFIPTDELNNIKLEVVRTESRIGAAKARNIGLQHSNSTYVTFIDDDDLVADNYIQSLLQCISSKLDVYVFPLKKERDGEVSSYKTFPHDVKDQLKIYYSNPGFGGQNVLYKKTALQKIGGFRTDLYGSEDRDVAARLLENNLSISLWDDTYVVMRVHEGDRNRHHGRLKGLRQFYNNHKFFMNTRLKILFGLKYLDHIYKIYLKNFIKQ